MLYTKANWVKKIPNILGKTAFQEKCQAFWETLFLTPPIALEPNWANYKPYDWNWPNLVYLELKNACLVKVKGKTLGPDDIIQDIIL